MPCWRGEHSCCDLTHAILIYAGRMPRMNMDNLGGLPAKPRGCLFLWRGFDDGSRQRGVGQSLHCHVSVRVCPFQSRSGSQIVFCTLMTSSCLSRLL